MSHMAFMWNVKASILFIVILGISIWGCGWIDKGFDKLAIWWRKRKKLARSCRIMGEWK